MALKKMIAKSHMPFTQRSGDISTAQTKNVDGVGLSSVNLQSTESMSPPNILHLQRTIGNAATRRMLNRAPASGAAIQRRLNFAPGELAGKSTKTGFGKLFDNSHTSTFREIEEALDGFHGTARDDAPKLQHYLTIIIDKSKNWLANVDHLSKSNETKQESLEKLSAAALVKRRRVIITKEIGVPYQIADTFDAAKVENFWKIVTTLDAKKPQEALAHFDAYQGYLGTPLFW
jgi:hypothetical protein